MITYSIVIPTYPPHIQYLSNILKQINNFDKNDKYSIIEIIIALSQINNTEAAELQQDLQSKTVYSVYVLPTIAKCNAAINRNRGWDNAKADWIVFLDADDIYNQKKLSITTDLIDTYPDINGIVHSYCRKKNVPHNIDFSTCELSLPKKIRDHTYPNGYTDPPLPEQVHNGKTNINAGNRSPVSHGILTVRKTFPIHYDARYTTGEDGVLCRYICASEGGLLFTSAPLMIYTS